MQSQKKNGITQPIVKHNELVKEEESAGAY